MLWQGMSGRTESHLFSVVLDLLAWLDIVYLNIYNMTQ